MITKNFLTLITLIGLSSCSVAGTNNTQTVSQTEEGNRTVAAAIDDGIDRVATSCGFDGDLLALENISNKVVPDQAKLLRGHGKVLQTFLTEDGRLVIVDMTDRNCEYDHLKLFHGEIDKTIAIGRQLFMIVKSNNRNLTGHLYMLEPDPKAEIPYRLYRVRGKNGVNFDRVANIQAKNQDGRRQLVVIGANGRPYAGANGLLDVNANGFAKFHLEAMRIHDGRRVAHSKLPQLQHIQPNVPELIILPRVSTTCTVQQKWEYIFGILPWSYEEQITCR